LSKNALDVALGRRHVEVLHHAMVLLYLQQQHSDSSDSGDFA
jgi:hypothetical protein